MIKYSLINDEMVGLKIMSDYVLFDDYIKEKLKWVEENNRLQNQLIEIKEILTRSDI